MITNQFFSQGIVHQINTDFPDEDKNLNLKEISFRTISGLEPLGLYLKNQFQKVQYQHCPFLLP
jgi:hypothetical protein